ncbi:MAG: hypothetical protein HOC28_10750 [Bacteroidetes Order II. Incertae sedis bacterium]|mgnify:FL=1|nr:hypothetical protein [Bacteroidetes Order II. bacterium]MBT4051985.1 hypothetical protein [Bacteroidetes Order II. bacterium]MBT4603604.1 hypothetical protein [Bacteroidetes Order II. bacterium]MBT5249107.1 hypothetical protein [Bacteroidetes Order II. bacterium]MBT6200689.1 hypothetical protein [Bacteroidetes Order II. bacterium]
MRRDLLSGPISLACILVVCWWILPVLVVAQPATTYSVVFTGTWSNTTHPLGFPANPHFSGLIGTTHNGTISIWTEGEIASAGIEQMAETGSKSTLRNEIQSAQQVGTAGFVLDGGGISSSPGEVALEFFVNEDHPYISLVSMLASFLGETEKALEYRTLHNAYHQREGNEVEAFGRIHDAIVEAKTGSDIEESRGNREKAMEHYMAYTDGFRLFKLRMDEGTIATTNFRLGALNEELGNLDEAIRRYTYFADRWNDAEADLQPQVAEARRRIGVLLDRKAQEN